MRKLISLLALLPSLAFGQYTGPVYNPANVNITGGSIAGITSLSVSGNGGVGGIFQANGGIKLQTFLTSALPICSSGNTGMMVAVLDASGTPAWNATLGSPGTGTPAATTTFPVFCDSTNWRIH